jgi:hypothetical protein
MQNNIKYIGKMTDKTIFRYKFSEPFVADLYNFAKIHQYDDRVGYKEAWGVWVEDNKELVSRECERLTSLDYDGDILDKMFKSARYYFRKKSTEKKAPATRREYVCLQKSVLEKMDRHIESNLSENKNYKPATGFTAFCEENAVVLRECMEDLQKQNMTDCEEAQNKIKKTYKNRYFIAINK